MAIIKCKMCGGDIELTAEKTFGTCEYCGSTVTLPKIDDEQRATAFNRGNHFRRSGEFDKALAVYERIVAEDDTDAEAHWCCALCRFGIEYVEDPATYEWLPTCHRASFDSFLEDVDYLAAVEHSDGLTKRQYQRDAVKIAEVQRGILATSQNEEPFDVFICYKETDANGNRTVDSTLAQDIYYQLTESGCRVFFARITLEDKGGAEYEPYIFAALTSAKIMVAVGTKPEHFNAVWVKNEWSRFLAMMRHDRSKLLLPCYRDMDPYDLPEQLSVLQSYDMSKIGFVQDLLRGIKKVLDAGKKPAPVKETVVVQAGNADIAPLLKRAFMFLEDGDWQSANEYCEKVLDKDPECAEAYLGKLMAELRVRKQADLRNQREPFDGKANYQKAVRFGTADLKAALGEDIKFIKERNEKARIEGIYTTAVKMAETAKTEADFKAAAAELQRISHYKDSAELNKKYLEKSEECRKNAIYNDAKATANKNTIKDCEAAIKKFQSIPGWKDAGEQMAVCNQKIDELKRKEEANKKAAAQRANKAKKIAVVCAATVVVIIAAALLTTKVIIPNGKYNDAVALMEAGQYEEAIAAFEAMDGYKDSTELKSSVIYFSAEEALKLGDFDTAEQLFVDLGEYKDAPARAKETIVEKAAKEKANHNMQVYNEASKLFSEKKYYEAANAFLSLGDYENSADMAKEAQYLRLVALSKLYVQFNLYDTYIYAADGVKTVFTMSSVNENNFGSEFQSAYIALIADEYSIETVDRAALAEMAKSDKIQGDSLFNYIEQEARALGDYKDVVELPLKTLNACYENGVVCVNKHKYSDAVKAFRSAMNYADASEKAEEYGVLGADTGDSIFFGSYEQDGNFNNGKEEIEWIVLGRDGDEVLLLSKYLLSEKAYADNMIITNYSEYHVSEAPWRDSTLRTWLNDVFFNLAFSSNEKEKIKTMETSLTYLSDTSTFGVVYKFTDKTPIVTNDKVRLLTLDEAEDYMVHILPGTSIAYMKGEDTPHMWWLSNSGRYHGDDLVLASVVSQTGIIGEQTLRNVSYTAYVRPVITVDLVALSGDHAA